jgi:DNA-binding MarR family transcriptional regulator
MNKEEEWDNFIKLAEHRFTDKQMTLEEFEETLKGLVEKGLIKMTPDATGRIMVEITDDGVKVVEEHIGPKEVALQKAKMRRDQN